MGSILENWGGTTIRCGRFYGQVEVRLTRLDRGDVHLPVVDDGPCIAPEDRPRMFERFRTDKLQGIAS